MTIQVKELTSEDELSAIWPFIQQLNPSMTHSDFAARLQKMREGGYRCAGAFDASGTLVGVSGFWLMTRFWCGTHVDIDNMVIDETRRGEGIGKALMAWVENWGREQGCDVAVLDSYTQNFASHKFYHREGFVIMGYHFLKPLHDAAKSIINREKTFR